MFNYLAHQMASMGDNANEYMLAKDGRMVKVGTKGVNKKDNLYDLYSDLYWLAKPLK